MANFGQAALTVVGAALGAVAAYYSGNPGFIMMGAELGNLAGQMAFPVKPPAGPDVHVMGASEGDPIKMVLGTARIPGTIIWAGPVHQSSSGGKGISPSAQTAKFNQSFALQLCVGPIVGIRKIWMDSGLVYDISNPANGSAMAASSKLASEMAIYLGDETQVPNGTIESYQGTGNVPAFRGTAYIVFIEFDITKYGPRIPNIEVEVVQNGTSSSSAQTLYAGPVVAPWAQGSNDPRQAAVPVTAVLSDGSEISGYLTPQYTYSYGSVSNGTLAAALAAAGGPGFLQSWSYGGTTPFRAQSDGGATVVGQPRDSVSLFLSYNWYSAPDYHWTYAPSLAGYLDSESSAGSLEQYGAGTAAFWYVGYGNNGAIAGFTRNQGAAGTVDPGTGACDMPSYPTAPAAIGLPHLSQVWYGLTYDPPGYDSPPTCLNAIRYTVSVSGDIGIGVSRALQAPPNRCDGQTGMPGVSGFCVIGGEVEQDTSWVPVSGSFRQLTAGRQASVGIPNSSWNFGWSTTTQNQTSWTVYPQGPVQPVGAENDNPTWWAAQLAAAIAAGRLPSSCSSWVYGTDYPDNVSSAYASVQAAESLTPISITTGTAVAAICAKCGMSSGQYDVSQLTDSLWGYVISRVTTGRDAITPLQSYGFFDAAVSSTGKLRFIRRGGAAVATLTEDDIGAVKDRQQGSNTTRLSTPRTADLELPQLVRLRYANTWDDYQPGMQPSQRLVTTSKVAADVDLSSIAMDPTTAAQVGDVFLRATWIGREEPAFAISSNWLGTIQAGDPVILNISGVSRRVRIKDLNYAWPGLLTVSSARDEEDAYGSIFFGALTGTGPTSSPQSPGLVPAGPAEILPLDIPALQTTDNQAGYYAAVYPLITASAWDGAGVFKSVNGGESYTELLSVSQIATIGTTVSALGAWTQGLDPKNSLHFNLVAGTPPASISLTALLNSGNVLAVGAPGRWEILQAQSVALQGDGSYIASTLLRGLLGTAWAVGTHQAGDTVVLLTGNIVRLDESITNKGVSELLKAVASGTALQDATAQSITPAEVCLTPLAPRCFRAGRNGAGDVVFQWIRQDRFANDLVPNTPIPMSEATEAYSLVIYTSGSYATVKRTISASTGSATYTAAQQIADFGALVAPGAGYAQVAQLSAAVGAGYTTNLNF